MRLKTNGNALKCARNGKTCINDVTAATDFPPGRSEVRCAGWNDERCMANPIPSALGPPEDSDDAGAGSAITSLPVFSS